MGYAVSFLLIVNDRLQINLPRVYGWLLGGISVTQWSQLVRGRGDGRPRPCVGGWLLRHSLDALSLGEESAQQLGIAVESDKRLVIVLGSVLTGAAVALGGLIGFVGLFAPHVTRVVVGPAPRLAAARRGARRRGVSGARRPAGPGPPAANRDPGRHPDRVRRRAILPVAAPPRAARVSPVSTARAARDRSQLPRRPARSPSCAASTCGVEPGEMVALIGPNGAGKSTLLRVARRTLRPSQRHGTARGRDLARPAAARARRQVAVVPQEGADSERAARARDGRLWAARRIRGLLLGPTAHDRQAVGLGPGRRRRARTWRIGLSTSSRAASVSG